jgi:eukaryotic-like serine/threonine-protein kinase
MSSFSLAPRRVHHRYCLKDPISSGRYGTVYRALDTKTSEPRAVKVIICGSDRDLRQQAAREARNMMRARSSPHVVYLHDVCSDGDRNVYLVEEYGEAFSLAASAYDPVEVVRDVALALRGLHRKDITFVDIKPENIIVTSSVTRLTNNNNNKHLPRYKLTDFGSSVRGGRVHASQVRCTPLYASPEIVTGDYVDRQHDVWALGVLGYTLVTGTHPFAGHASDPGRLLQSIASGRGIDLARVPDDSALKPLLRGMLALEPSERLTVEQVCNGLGLNSNNNK